MIKVLLWDIDGTLLNFKKAEEASIKKLFLLLNLGICSDEMLAIYSQINEKYWKMIEKGTMSKEEILVNRFVEFFTKYHLDVNKAKEFNDYYQIELGNHVFFNDDAFSIVKKLKKDFIQYAVTNGTEIAQRKKIKNSCLDQVLNGFFISDVIGFEKPSKNFFFPVFAEINKIDSSIRKDEIMIIGDSLTSDIKGGNNVGIKCCWYNKEKNKNNSDCQIDYEIKNLQELLAILNRN